MLTSNSRSAASSQPNGLKRISVDGATRLVYADEAGLHPVEGSLGDLLASGRAALASAVSSARSSSPLSSAAEVRELAPVDEQEVWASGVTYQRSRAARVSESAVADVYDLVYEAERPELFLKATASRVTEPGRPLRVRADSSWDVPEPELALVITADAEVVGYAVADDMSSREIEGANPLYLPQAKIFDDCVALSDTIVLADDFDRDITNVPISLWISRDGDELYAGTTNTSNMKRTIHELVEHLFRELSHPRGVVLITGTGIVPPDEITLEPGDDVTIEIEGVGRLHHGVYRVGRSSESQTTTDDNRVADVSS